MRIGYPALFAIYAVAEAALLIWFWAAFGTPALIGLLLTGFLLGLLVMRLAGMSAFRALSGPDRSAPVRVSSPDGAEGVVLQPRPTQAQQEQAVRDAARGVGTSSLLFVAGVLLAAPGILSDLAGLALLLPMVRRRIADRFSRSLSQSGGTRVTVVTVDASGPASRPDPGAPTEPVVIRGELLPPPRDH